jgi:hypothetical protein
MWLKSRQFSDISRQKNSPTYNFGSTSASLSDRVQSPDKDYG